jgi:UDP-2-acetamido-2,6-beta-L-arabino-hexul-4-ose reductase
LKVGITGYTGFIGYHLRYSLIHKYKGYEIIVLGKDDFNNSKKVDSFINQSEIIVHLAGINRHKNEDFIFSENLRLANTLIESIDKNKFQGKLVFASSIQQNTDTTYGHAKKQCSELFSRSSIKNNFQFINLIIPNVFGPFCKPNYNSFIATFCHNLINNIDLEVKSEASVPIIYIDSLIIIIINLFKDANNDQLIEVYEEYLVKPYQVKEVLLRFKNDYILNRIMPNFNNSFEKNLFNTLSTYLNIKQFYPLYNTKHIDERGFFSEVSKINGNAQFSYSITKENITRGNHFHTNKIERFTVIDGDALIKIRKIGSEEVIEFEIKENLPVSIDMIPWHTHNITNIGKKDLVTLFSINDFFDHETPDTYHETV